MVQGPAQQSGGGVARESGSQIDVGGDPTGSQRGHRGIPMPPHAGQNRAPIFPRMETETTHVNRHQPGSRKDDVMTRARATGSKVSKGLETKDNSDTHGDARKEVKQSSSGRQVKPPERLIEEME